MKNHYTVTCKPFCKINDLKKNSGALHLVGCLSHCKRKLITWRWRSYKGRRLAFIDSSSFQHLHTESSDLRENRRACLDPHLKITAR